MNSNKQMTAKNKKIALITMPWAVAGNPSIQLGILQASAEAEGYYCDSLYFNLDLAVQIGLEIYQKISSTPDFRLLAEWLFSKDLLGDYEPSVPEGKANYLDFLKCSNPGGKMVSYLEAALGEDYQEKLIKLREEIIPSYLDVLASQVVSNGYDVVGFTITYNQIFPSLALARRIWTSCPDCILVLGGTGINGTTGHELHRAFPWISYIVYGEAEKRFVMLLNSLAKPENVSHIPGISYSDGSKVSFTEPAVPPKEIDYPIPNYDDYYSRVFELEKASKGELQFPRLPIYFESSRGCWWGKCEFCSLCLLDRNFRERDAQQVLRELLHLSSKYEHFRFQATDLVNGKVEFPKLIKALQDHQLSLFFEFRCSLTESLVAELAKAGVNRLQLGIESLSTKLLRAMKKGSTGIRNIESLKLCRKYNIDAVWNYLYGFPKESVEDYEQVSQLIPQIYHLQPPELRQLLILRSIPYQRHPQEYGISKLRPIEDYNYLFPPGLMNQEQFALFFEGNIQSLPSKLDYIDSFTQVVDGWRGRYYGLCPAALIYRMGPGFIKILDHRQPNPEFVTLRHEAVTIYAFCEQVRHKERIYKHLKEQGKTCSLLELEDILAELVAARLMLKEKDLYLSLAIPAAFRGRPAVADYKLNFAGW